MLAAIVQSWPRCARATTEALYRLGVQAVVDLEPELLPTRVSATRLGEALETLVAAALAVVRRLDGNERDLWPVICVITRGRLLAPALSP
jgi:hypothetical protein